MASSYEDFTLADDVDACMAILQENKNVEEQICRSRSGAFVPIPAVITDWAIFGLKTTGVVLAKMAANNAVPGLGAAVDFAQAAYDLRQGDIVGAAINTVSGVADLYSLGLFGSVKEAMKEGAKESTKEGAKVMGKKAGKEATKKFGHKVARQVAEGSLQGGKEAATKYASAWAEEARKKATKKFGKRLGKEIGRGLIPESVEKVFKEGTKKAAGGILDDLKRKAISTGGNDVVKGIFMEYYEEGIQRVTELGIQAMKQKPKLTFEFAKIAKEGALKEFEKHTGKIIAKDFAVACVKGGIRSCSATDNATFRLDNEFQLSSEHAHFENFHPPNLCRNFSLS